MDGSAFASALECLLVVASSTLVNYNPAKGLAHSSFDTCDVTW